MIAPATSATTTSVADRTGTRAHRVVAAIGPNGGLRALRMASLVSHHTGDPLTVVSVVEVPAMFAYEHAELNPWKLDEEKDARRSSIRHRLRDLYHLDGAPRAPAVEVTFGTPPSAIADTAREVHARLIVMGIGPHSLRHRIFSSETALGTSRRASCAVLAVHERARGLPRSVVVAVDFSPESIHAARAALSLLGDGADVHLVHVWNRIHTPYPVPTFGELDEAYLRAVPARFLRMQKLLESSRPLCFSTSVREGEPAEQLLDVARERVADLIVAGMRGIGALERLFVGSVSTALLRAAECSVLLVPGPPILERAELIRLMSGTSTDRVPEHWALELDAFARRNVHRRVSLEIDEHALGAQRQASGYRLLGATYDPHDQRVALMFGGLDASRPHFTHTIGTVRSVAVAGRQPGVDDALCIESEGGRAILTFLDQ